MSREAFERTVARVVEQNKKTGGEGAEGAARAAVAPLAIRQDAKPRAHGEAYHGRSGGVRAKDIPKAEIHEHRLTLDDIPAAEPVADKMLQERGLKPERSGLISGRATGEWPPAPETIAGAASSLHDHQAERALGMIGR
jgi:hypothetical protein